MSKRRLVRFSAVISITALLLIVTGCFRNTPSSVAERFIENIRKANWEKMVKMVDWETTKKHANALPEGTEKDLIYTFASQLTRSDFHRLREEDIKTRLVYLSVESTEVLEDKESTAKVKVTWKLDRDHEPEDVTLSLRKVKREWKVVMTPELFE